MSTNTKMHNKANAAQQFSLAPQLLSWLKILQVSTPDLSRMINDELACNPVLEAEQGGKYQTGTVEHVEADLEIYSKDDQLHVKLMDEHLPKLKLSNSYTRILETHEGSKEDLDYIRSKVRDANFLIEGISQRQDTMLKVARQIIRAQHEFLTTADGQLKPLTMNKVAAMIGVHETTVSRTIANKYVQTDRGLIEMRAFFKVGYRCADGSSVATERVMEMVARLIKEEDPLNPVIDSQISERLKKLGLKVARRTVAKYREEMNILSSKERLVAAQRQIDSKMQIAV